MYCGCKIYGLPIYNYDGVIIKIAPYYYTIKDDELKHSRYPKCMDGFYQKICLFPDSILDRYCFNDRHR